jgi:hypothetical protein
LREWIENDNAVLAYQRCADAAYELRGAVLVLYERVFAGLPGAFEALLDIFRHNKDDVQPAGSESLDAGRPYPEWLIWPHEFGPISQTDADADQTGQLMDRACVAFLEDMAENISMWSGYDLRMDHRNVDEAGRETDIAGFIQAFTNRYFVNLAPVSIEDVMSSYLSDGQTLNDHIHDRLTELKRRSILTFCIDETRASALAAQCREFALASIPADCLAIRGEAGQCYGHSVSEKASREESRVGYMKALTGLPLYAYSHMHDCAKYYGRAMRDAVRRRCIHLDPAWADFPDPIPTGLTNRDSFAR